MKIKIALGLCLIGGIFIILFFIIQRNAVSSTPSNPSKLQVVTTFYPLQYFSEQVGGDDIEIVSLTPNGGEPHDYEPTPKDIITINKADVFVLNGIVEPWAQRIVPQLQMKKLKVVNLSSVVNLLTASESAEDNTGIDPHFWLDPLFVQAQVLALRDAFIEKDPEHADHYQQNAQNFIAQLADLDTAYKRGLQNCARTEIVTSHNAFAYLAQR